MVWCTSVIHVTGLQVVNLLMDIKWPQQEPLYTEAVSTRSFATEKSTARPSCLVGVI